MRYAPAASHLLRAGTGLALAACLSGCNAAVQSNPSGALPAARGEAHAVRIVADAKLFRSPEANARLAAQGTLRRVGAGHFAPFARAGKPPGFVFLSDTLTGNVDTYNETTGALITTCAGCGGWGLAISGTGNLAMGAYGGVVTLWHVAQTGITQYGTCTLSGAADDTNAVGITWDGKGGIYAGNWPSNTIDYFSAATIAGGCTAPTLSLETTNLEVVFYLAIARKGLLADGYTFSGDADLMAINEKTGADTELQTIGNLSAGTGYPGGVAADAAQNVYVVNQYGTVTSFATSGRGAENGSCLLPSVDYDETALALGTTEKNFFAATANFTGSVTETFGLAEALPLGSGAVCTLQYQTSPEQASEQYIGAAVWKRGKV
jgi:hypothetical protein